MHQILKHVQSLIFIIIMVTIWGCSVEPSVSEIELKEHWSFKKSTDSEWDKATVPGTVHTDLISLGKIEDPYYRLNEHNLQWIDKADWEYKTNFKLSAADLDKQNIALEFLGLDTYSKIFLNETLILQTDNMFRDYAVEVKQWLKEGDNELHIYFDSPIKVGIEKYDAQDFVIPVSDNDLSIIGKVEGNKKVSVYTRKAGYHFGWDWGPRLVTSGIWRPIMLKSWDHHKIDDVFIQQHSIGEKANLTAVLEVTANGEEDAELEIFVNGNPIKKESVQLGSGKNNLNIPFEIEDPQLWWPNGMGEQVLYNVAVKLTSGSYVDEKSRKIGLRTIELVQEPDSIGASFYFKVNGHPVFMKGANYIPQDVFLPRANKENYDHILSSAQEANMNMIRVWGGGIYENDYFYQLCDEKGLLVWQDFMFACAMFPGDTHFLNNVKKEAIDNVKRLRNHPSIALWCGNNEIMVAWENWGWSKKVALEQSQAVADTIWKAYEDIFHKILPEVVADYDNSRPYWPSSPGSGFGETESMDKGDAHYWMVWWGKEPFDNYSTQIPRFMSEYGFQSFPELSTVEKYTIPEDHDIYSEVMKSHQRSSIGNETIEEYMLRHYRKPKDFASFLYVSQLLQAHGIKVGIEAHRRNRQRCMGSLYWQINDCWPVASWSSIDYYGKWKALHYTAKKMFKNFMISTVNEADNINVFVVSDTLQNVNAKLQIRLIDFDGNLVQEWEKQIVADANTSKEYFSLAKSDFVVKPGSDNLVIHAQLISLSDNKELAENIIYLSPYKTLNFPDPNLTYSIKENEDQFEVSLKTEKLAKDVYLSSESAFNFSDNYFDMLPNSEKTVSIKKSQIEDIETFRDKLKVITLTDTY